MHKYLGALWNLQKRKYFKVRTDSGGELKAMYNLFRSLENYILILALNDRASLGTLANCVESHFFFKLPHRMIEQDDL